MSMTPEILDEEFKQFSGIAVNSNRFTAYVLHSHTFYEIEYICEGEVSYTINGESTVISAGDLVLVSPTDLHSYEILKGGLVKTITIHFKPELINGLNAVKSAVLSCDERLRNMIYLLKNEYLHCDRYAADALKNILSYIMILILRHKEADEVLEVPKNISNITDYIQSNFRSEIDIDVLCAEVGYSKSYLCRQFKRYMNLGISEYINNTRLSYAEKLLVMPGFSISQVCFECGFGSIRHFNRLFSARYGCTPMQFAKKGKMDNGVDE